MQNDMYDMIPSNEKINSKLLSKHIYFLNGDIDSYSVEEAIKWILYENTEGESDKVLSMYINSLGGSLTDALALVDIMRQSRFPIKTIGIGSIVSAGFMIFACGTKGMRIISKNTSIMIHQYSDGIMGKHHDLEAHIKEMQLTNDRITNILKEVSNLNLRDVKSKLIPPSDVWLTPQELVNYGVADVVV